MTDHNVVPPIKLQPLTCIPEEPPTPNKGSILGRIVAAWNAVIVFEYRPSKPLHSRGYLAKLNAMLSWSDIYAARMKTPNENTPQARFVWKGRSLELLPTPEDNTKPLNDSTKKLFGLQAPLFEEVLAEFKRKIEGFTIRKQRLKNISFHARLGFDEFLRTLNPELEARRRARRMGNHTISSAFSFYGPWWTRPLKELFAHLASGRARAGKHNRPFGSAKSLTPVELASMGFASTEERDAFLEENMKLVGWVARKYRGKGLSWQELLLAGAIGLLKARKRFDAKKGKFSTIAVFYIKGEICSEFESKKKQRKSDARIRATQYGVPLVMSQIAEQETGEEAEWGERATKDLDAQNEPEGEELTDHADLREAVLQEAEIEIDHEAGEAGHSAQEARSEGLGSSDGHALEDVAFSDDAPSPSEPRNQQIADSYSPRLEVDTEVIEAAIDRLPNATQALVLRMRLGLGGQEQSTLAEIGETFHISAQRVAAIEKQAIANLRKDSELQETI